MIYLIIKIIIITGQTATGKTAFAQQLAHEQNGELINCDSRQIYQHLDIVTGKDTRNGTYHLFKKLGDYRLGYYTDINTNYPDVRTWLYDIVPPNIAFSAHDYETCASWVIDDIQNRGKLPIVVGGTYLYIDYLFVRENKILVPPNWDLRQKLKNHSVDSLQDKLKSFNTKMYTHLNISDRQNPHRLIRKIEIAHHFRLKKNVQNEPQHNKQYDSEIHGFRFSDRQLLRQAIRKRVINRLDSGAIEETLKLLRKRYTQSSPGLRAIGYAQIIQHINKEIDYEKLIELWTTKEVQYAKRQETFMNNNPRIIWHEIT